MMEVDCEVTVGSLRLKCEFQHDGGTIALVGPNGSGKTSLLRALVGALPIASGRITLNGRILYDGKEGVEVPMEARRMGYVPQGYGLFPHLRALENVAFGLRTGKNKLPVARAHHKAMQALRELDCGHIEARFPRQLSGGEQQRVALARALLTEPDLLLLDEPMAALDVSARRSVRAFLSERIKRAACPTIIVTHDVRDLESFSPTILVLQQGQIIQRGSLDSLRTSPTSAYVEELVGAPLG